jgi:NAD(P)-dependent dehydrogenase (short-subunit alcohol dehydrogenase family)
MIKPLEGRVALVTGGGRGIGSATALALARLGAYTTVLARTSREIDAIAAEINASGGHSLAIQANVADYAQMRDAIQQIEQTAGPVDILINNAAILTLGPLATSDPVVWANTIQINTIGAYYCMRLVLPGMLARGWGRIVNVSSFAGAGPNRPNGSAYAASKAALDRLTRSAAAETAGTGVTVTAMYPGDTNTYMQAQIREAPITLIGQEESTFFRERYARGELYDPALPARLIVALVLSDLNGEVINIDDERGQALLRQYENGA